MSDKVLTIALDDGGCSVGYMFFGNKILSEDEWKRLVRVTRREVAQGLFEELARGAGLRHVY